jgi:hypothetical protein
MEPLFTMQDESLRSGEAAPAIVSALVVGGEAIVAMDLLETLEECGVSEIVHCRDAADLTFASAARGFEVAFVNLDGSEAPLHAAALLARLGTPIVMIGSLEDVGLAERPVGLLVIRKPYARHQIANALDRVSAAAWNGRSPKP